MAKDNDFTLGSSDSQLAELYQSREYQQSSEKFKAKVRASSQPGPFGLRTKVLWVNLFLIILKHVFCVVGAVVGTQAKWQSWVCYVAFMLFRGYVCTCIMLISRFTAKALELWHAMNQIDRVFMQQLLMLLRRISLWTWAPEALTSSHLMKSSIIFCLSKENICFSERTQRQIIRLRPLFSESLARVHGYINAKLCSYGIIVQVHCAKGSELLCYHSWRSLTSSNMAKGDSLFL